MGTGYGLSDYGLWPNHSWGLKQTAGGRVPIVETTVSREIYFGVPLPREALFASAIVYFSTATTPAPALARIDRKGATLLSLVLARVGLQQYTHHNGS
jgi:hypothetical protein